MVVTNTITFVSYFSICVTLFYLARRTRRSIHRDWGYSGGGIRALYRGLRIDPLDGRGHDLEPGVLDRRVDEYHHGDPVRLCRGAIYPQARQDLGFGINDYALRLANSESEKAQIEESLLAARKLEEWNRMSAVVTHEIDNPLAAIQNLMFLIEISSGATPEIVPWRSNRPKRCAASSP